MLVLERKVQEGFWIQDRIFVKVLGIGRRRVKLGIDAPSDFRIMRDELWSPALSEGSGGRDLSVVEEGAQAGDRSGASAELRRGRRRHRNDQRAA